MSTASESNNTDTGNKNSGNKKKNVLFITSDQQHWFTLGFQNPEIQTPNLDRLAARGCTFNRAYAVNPTCTPTRASWITGTYPSQHGAYSLGTKLMEDVPVVGDNFIDNGYRTALIGKAHFQPLETTEEFPSLESYPMLQDYEFWKNFDDKFYGFQDIEIARNHTDASLVGQHYVLWMEEKGFDTWREHFLPPTGTKEFSKGTWDIPEEYHYDAWIAESTNKKLEEYKKNDENFYLWASFFDPHVQYLVSAPWDKMYDPKKVTIPKMKAGEHDKNPPHFSKTQEQDPDYKEYAEKDGNYSHGFHSHLRDDDEMAQDIATYYGMISLMDKYIGKILNKLDELGLTEDTMVVFTTDHGHFYGHHGLTAKGAFHYEDLVKIPMIASLPGAIPEGITSNKLQSSVDIAPTFLAAAGIDIPRTMTGKNMLPEWTGEVEEIRDHVLVENHHQPTTVHCKTFINQRYKLTMYFNQDYGELFDLQEDPGEYDNLWAEAEAQNLKLDLTQKLVFAEMGKEPMPMPRIGMA